MESPYVLIWSLTTVKAGLRDMTYVNLQLFVWPCCLQQDVVCLFRHVIQLHQAFPRRLKCYLQELTVSDHCTLQEVQAICKHYTMNKIGYFFLRQFYLKTIFDY